MYVKTHITEKGETLVAVCDSDLLGQVFEEGNKQLDLRTDFYNGEKKSKKDVADLIRNADLVNLVGEKAIKAGMIEELFEEKDVKRIAGIPIFQSLSNQLIL